MPRGVYERTPEARANIAAARHRYFEDPVARARAAASQRRRYEDPAERAKVSAALRDRKPSSETRAKLAAAKWQGEAITYSAAHWRARRALASRPCAQGGATCGGPLQAAFRHDAPAAFVRRTAQGSPFYVGPDPLDGYRMLCQSHHKRYDQEVA